MNELLKQAMEVLRSDPKLAEVVVREENGELHLLRGDDRFARIKPSEHKGLWWMEYFQNRERLEVTEFQGTLRECLDFLAENAHYQFWEG